jgi:hypothetical protein
VFLINALAHLLNSALGLAIFVGLCALWIWALYDCSMRRFRNPSHKWLWLGAIFITAPIGPLAAIGAMAYLIIGREQGYRYR